jgi:Holliday junction resolvase RusA-like endonuclease
MSYFTFTVPGHPMSWNRSYRQRVYHVKDRFGQAIQDDRGRLKTRSGMFKTKEAEVYQDTVRWLAKTAKPSDFSATQIIIAYDFMLARDIDCDNVMKMINDAVAEAIGLNDKHFFPAVLSKTTGSFDPSVMVHVYDRRDYQVKVTER